MLDNFTFTLYEVFGYLIPGALVLVGLSLVFWALFVPTVPLAIATFQPGLMSWVGLLLTSYLLGHAVQAVGNPFLKGAEVAALGAGGTIPEDIRKAATELGGTILNISSDKLDPGWVYKTLDEHCVQTGEVGDREMFVYREGFYRGTAISLFFLTAALVVRTCFHGTALQFTKSVFYISYVQILATGLISGVTGWLFVRRYRRFAEYRVTHAVVAALLLRNAVVSNKTKASSATQ